MIQLHRQWKQVACMHSTRNVCSKTWNIVQLLKWLKIYEKEEIHQMHKRHVKEWIWIGLLYFFWKEYFVTCGFWRKRNQNIYTGYTWNNNHNQYMFEISAILYSNVNTSVKTTQIILFLWIYITKYLRNGSKKNFIAETFQHNCHC